MNRKRILTQPRAIKGYREFASGWNESKPRRTSEDRTRNAEAISENPKAEVILGIIKREKLTIRQIAKRAGVTWGEAELILIWIENHVCLLTEDDFGRLQIYKEGR
jgi:hypothetical protein